MEAQQAHTRQEPLEGKRVLITGGSTGIGRAIATLLGTYGARILTLGREQAVLDEALAQIRAAGGTADGLVADLARPEDIRRVFAEADRVLGGLDIVVANAAVSGKAIADMEDADWRYVVETNLLGYMGCAREAVLRMREQGRGHLVFIGSMSADLREGDKSVYVATKTGVQGFVESLRKEVNPEGIKVSLIEPGLVQSAIHERSPEEQARMVRQEEMLRAEDIAVAVHYVLTQPLRCDVVSLQIRPHGQVI